MGLLRFLLALAVVMVHSRPDTTVLTGGRPAVQLFYTISGFYMALVLNRKYLGPRSNRLFLANRFFRLYPAYFFILLATILTSAAVYLIRGPAFTIKHWAYQPTWLKNGPTLAPLTALFLIAINLTLIGQDAAVFLSVDRHTGNLQPATAHERGQIAAYRFQPVPQAWTLGVELLFYLLAPFLLRRRPAIIAAALLLVAAARWYGRHHLGLGIPPWDYRFFPFELPLFLAGALAYKAYAALSATRWLSKPFSIPAFLLMLAGILFFQKLHLESGPLGWPWFCFAFAACLPWIFHLTRNIPLDRWIGELSYPIYIGHWFVLGLLDIPHSPTIQSHLAPFAIAGSIALAILIQLAIDGPIDRWRHARLAAMSIHRRSESRS